MSREKEPTPDEGILIKVANGALTAQNQGGDIVKETPHEESDDEHSVNLVVLDEVSGRSTNKTPILLTPTRKHQFIAPNGSEFNVDQRGNISSDSSSNNDPANNIAESIKWEADAQKEGSPLIPAAQAQGSDTVVALIPKTIRQKTIQKSMSDALEFNKNHLYLELEAEEHQTTVGHGNRSFSFAMELELLVKFRSW